MLTRADYFMGRDEVYASDMTPEIEEAAASLIRRINVLLDTFGEYRTINSGWRPPEINGATPGASPTSKHMTGQACDLADPEGDLDEWCCARASLLTVLGLWMEHPASTKGWCHVQTVAPKSGSRVFYP